MRFILHVCRFDIDWRTGRITVKPCERSETQSCFDYDRAREYRLKVLAKDKCGEGLSSETTVVVSITGVNRRSPEFLGPFSGRINEGDTDPRITVQVGEGVGASKSSLH